MCSARYYDGLSRVMSFGTDGWYRRQTLIRAGLAAGMSMLDVGCGTGLSAGAARSIVGPQGYVVGVEPSRGMLGKRWGASAFTLAFAGSPNRCPSVTIGSIFSV